MIEELNTTFEHFGLNEKPTWVIEKLGTLSKELLQGLK
ncbi:hypothetical protein N473_24675 [Pseudoalteromonas luteoviolacea CPMOR-1]|uniref:Uncharacterized protein n=1 Tax=Pseudoalteromonas luteoviolacea CPMOR-1 TaxID=1365248 RepID=A0A167IWV1_9GAMM|nr:hypothetical protein N473_24675 [Pseudoalteromonas luteoviolacea CPMOR-1]